MSQRHSIPSSQILQRPSAGESSPYREDRSNTSRNPNGKRSRDDLQEDQAEDPRKTVRLDVDRRSGREESRQPSNPIANIPNPKDEQEFVDGPGHIVFVEERGKRCPAICFNKSLFSRLTHIAVDSRELRKRDEEIKKARLEFEKIKSANKSAGIEKARMVVEEALKNQEDIEAEIPGLVEARQRYDSLVQENNWSTSVIDNSKEIARLVIEEILTRANLLTIPTSKPQESIEVKEDHPAILAPMPNTVYDTETSKIPEIRSPASSTATLESPIDTEEQPTPRQLALRRLRFAAEELDYRKGHFEFMQEEYSQGKAAERRYWHEQYPDRPESITQTDFDLECLQKKQRVTREVIEAEEAYDRAEQDAEDLGLGDILADPQAYYWGEIHNNFGPSTPKISSTMPADDPRIEAWIASIPAFDVMAPQTLEVAGSAEVDEWEAKSVEAFESVSLVDYDMYRKKIDKWQELSDRLRQAEAEGPLPRTVRRNPRRRCRVRQSPRTRS